MIPGRSQRARSCVLYCVLDIASVRWLVALRLTHDLGVACQSTLSFGGVDPRDWFGRRDRRCALALFSSLNGGFQICRFTFTLDRLQLPADLPHPVVLAADYSLQNVT